MRTLYIIRHAKAGWKDSRSDDFHRPLKEEGVIEAIRQAELLKQNKVKPDLIISSPAFRALNTAIIFAEVLQYPFSKIELSEKMYEADEDALLDVVHACDDKHEQVMMFGHNVGLSYFASYFNAGKELMMPTAGIVKVELDIVKWEEASKNRVKNIQTYFT